MLFGDDRRVETQQLLIDAIDKSSSYNELYTNITNAQSKANELLQNMQRSVQLIVNLLIQLVQYKISCRKLKDKTKTEVLIIWNELKAVDEHITVDKIMTYKPYRNVIPFDDERLPQILSWLKERIDKSKIPISCSIAEVEYNSNLDGEIACYQNLWDTMVVSTTQTLIGESSCWLAFNKF